MVKLTPDQIALICREAAKGWVLHRPASLAKLWGVTTRRIRQIAQQHRETGEVPQLKPQGRPKSPPLTAEEKQLIDDAHSVTLRGATKTWKHLRRNGIHIAKHKVHTHFRARRYTNPNPKKQKKRKRVRYEREHSGSLLHGDWHQKSQNHPYVILWMDDASRKILSGGEYPAISAESSIATLDMAIRSAALYNLQINQVNTDRGSEFYANLQRGKTHGTSQFTRHLESLGVQHVPSRAHNPQTNGKIERFWLEYDRHRERFSTLEDFIAWANQQTHDELWHDDQLGIYEVPDEAFERKLPPETLLHLHHRLAQEAVL